MHEVYYLSTYITSKKYISTYRVRRFLFPLGDTITLSLGDTITFFVVLTITFNIIKIFIILFILFLFFNPWFYLYYFLSRFLNRLLSVAFKFLLFSFNHHIKVNSKTLTIILFYVL